MHTTELTDAEKLQSIANVVQAANGPITGEAIRERCGHQLPRGWLTKIEKHPNIKTYFIAKRRVIEWIES